MFYAGDLQSGITKAVQEVKLLACFVTDDGEESKKWENDFLQEHTAILLRLVAGSQEAGFLAAIYPLPKTPTLVIIKNGDLKEYISSGVTKEEFIRRLDVVLQSPSLAAPSVSTTPTTTATQELPAAPSSQVERAPATTSPAPATRPQPESLAVQNMLAERAARLEVDKKEKEATEKARRTAEGKARKAAMEEEAPPAGQKSADMTYALMQKKRQQEARAERERILKRVEDDKAERREREAQRKAQAKAKEQTEKEEEGEPPASSSISQPSLTSRSSHCALQVRLFDGSTIRSRFPSDGSLRVDVRRWIDEQQTGDTPYTFKHVLTPLPNKNISISDEEQTLYSQGLTPSATLILVPVQGYTSAYKDGASSGIVARVASGGYSFVSSGLGLVTGLVGSLLGSGSGSATTPATQERPANPVPPNANPAINVRTLRDRDRDDQQFYNGNALNFEPRKDGDKKEE